ncbi:copper radical oxidase [Moniliophthora roreri MCA 2997]|nr:copper radical oxidase [Moniliophthora roreri MCA 2997]
MSSICSLPRNSLIHLFILFVVEVAFAAESAWNGHTTPQSVKPAPFSPYYAALGTKSIDSDSPLIHYSGAWYKSYGPRYVAKSKRATYEPDATVSFAFTGSRIECYGSRGNRHGPADVFINGSLVDSINTWDSSATERTGQVIYVANGLPKGRHVIKLVNRSTIQKFSLLDIDAFVISPHPRAITHHTPAPSRWTLSQKGSTGVGAMQLTVLSSDHALIIDKVEHNPLVIDGHPAWAALYNMKIGEATPLPITSNSFCAGGSFLGNGTLVNIGGNPVVEDHTSAADFGDTNGIQAIRLLHPYKSVDECAIYENPSRIRMASPRWYNTVTRLSDGSVMIVGGSTRGGWINNATVNNPTIEYFPPKSIHGSNGRPIPIPFLRETVGANLFPIVFSLPDGRVFMAANQDAMIYDWRTHTERRLPRFPNDVRVSYPMAASGALLPLSPDNGYTPEILICGGSTIDDKRPSWEISSQEPASAQCVRMVLSEEGIGKGWKVEHMPHARLMPDIVILPNGQIVIVNGAGSGISGYGNVRDQVGASNAANPVFEPVLYDPLAPAGQRFSTEALPRSDIPRLYHSVATLTPQGDIMIAGSNPNLDRSEITYRTEYRVERLSPPYMAAQRPVISDLKLNQALRYAQPMLVSVDNCKEGAKMQVALLDYGFVTHGVHMNMRMVYLKTSWKDEKLEIMGPPDNGVYPPGPAWLHAICDGIPSEGARVMCGDGRDPPVDEAAIASVLKLTKTN